MYIVLCPVSFSDLACCLIKKIDFIFSIYDNS